MDGKFQGAARRLTAQRTANATRLDGGRCWQASRGSNMLCVREDSRPIGQVHNSGLPRSFDDIKTQSITEDLTQRTVDRVSEQKEDYCTDPYARGEGCGPSRRTLVPSPSRVCTILAQNSSAGLAKAPGSRAPGLFALASMPSRVARVAAEPNTLDRDSTADSDVDRKRGKVDFTSYTSRLLSTFVSTLRSATLPQCCVKYCTRLHSERRLYCTTLPHPEQRNSQQQMSPLRELPSASSLMISNAGVTGLSYLSSYQLSR